MRGQPAVGIARREAAVAQASRSSRAAFATRALQLIAQRGVGGARRHQVLAADQLAGLLEDAWRRRRPPAGRTRRPSPGLAVSAARGVGAAADRADDEFVRAHRRPAAAPRADASAAFDPRRARRAIVLRVPPVSWITSVLTGRPGRRDDPGELPLVEALAAERDEQHRRRRSDACRAAPSSRARRRSGSSRESRSGARPARGTAWRSRARRDARTRPDRRPRATLRMPLRPSARKP